MKKVSRETGETVSIFSARVGNRNPYSGPADSIHGFRTRSARV